MFNSVGRYLIMNRLGFLFRRRPHVGGVYVRKDALRPPKEHGGRGASAAWHYSGEAEGQHQGDLRCELRDILVPNEGHELTTVLFPISGDEKVLGPQSRGSSVVPEPEGAVDSGRPRTDGLKKPSALSVDKIVDKEGGGQGP